MSIENEIWKDIEGWEDLYSISNTGKVFSKRTNKILEPTLSNTGYYKVNLSNGFIKKRISIHKLVAKAFVENPNPDKFTIINHKDENKLNNNADNLEWCDYHYNNTYGTVLERRNETWNNKDEATKEAYSQSQSKITKEFWDTKDENYRKECGQKSKEIWDNKSEEEKQSFRDKMSTVNKQNWENKSDESKKEFSNIVKDIWKNKTPEQMKAFGELQTKLNKERFNALSEEEKEIQKEKMRQLGYMCSIMSQIKNNFDSLCSNPFNYNKIHDDECGDFIEPNNIITMCNFDNKKIFTVKNINI